MMGQIIYYNIKTLGQYTQGFLLLVSMSRERLISTAYEKVSCKSIKSIKNAVKGEKKAKRSKTNW